MSTKQDEIFIDESLFDPYKINKPQLEVIRRIARVVMNKEKCCYTKAVIIAYIEWLAMAEIEQVRH